MPDASLDDLASYFRPLAEKLLAGCASAGVPCRVVDTLRTGEEQAIKVAQHLSWTRNSKHLPQPPEAKSEAIDIVPQAILGENKPDWDPASPLWNKIGMIGVGMGLTWGGNWSGAERDPSHFEYKKENK